MSRNIKIDLKKRARISVGILNLLSDDLNQVRIDSEDFDLICLEESLKDVRTTIEMLLNHISEMEYMLYLIKSRD